MSTLFAHDWEIDRQTDIRLLGEYDLTQDPMPLHEFIPIIELADEEQGSWQGRDS